MVKNYLNFIQIRHSSLKREHYNEEYYHFFYQNFSYTQTNLVLGVKCSWKEQVLGWVLELSWIMVTPPSVPTLLITFTRITFVSSFYDNFGDNFLFRIHVIFLI